MITEFAPYGDLLGFLRKKRGLKDNYYNIEHLPKRNLTSKQLMRFAWEIADGMAYLSSVKVSYPQGPPVLKYMLLNTLIRSSSYKFKPSLNSVVKGFLSKWKTLKIGMTGLACSREGGTMAGWFVPGEGVGRKGAVGSP